MERVKTLLLHSEGFGEAEALPLNLYQWFFSSINLPIRLGPLRPGNRAVLVTKIIGEKNVMEMQREGSIPKVKKSTIKKRPTIKKETIADIALAPDSVVSMTFAAYRVCVVLDTCRSSFAMAPDGSLPFTKLAESALSAIVQLTQRLSAMKYVSRLYVSLVTSTGASSAAADGGDISVTRVIWTGEIEMDADISVLMQILRIRIKRIEEEIQQEKIKAFSGTQSTTLLQQEQTVLSGLPIPPVPLAFIAARNHVIRKQPDQFPDLLCHLQAAAVQLDSLPEKGCPLILLCTCGNMDVNYTASKRLLLKQRASLHVIIENPLSTRSSRPAGFFPGTAGLKSLACGILGGSVTVLERDSLADIQLAVKELCFHPRFLSRRLFLAPRRLSSVSAFAPVAEPDDEDRDPAVESPDVATSDGPTYGWTTFQETQPSYDFQLDGVINCADGGRRVTELQSYTLEGATLEHLLSIHGGEGFRIVDVLYAAGEKHLIVKCINQISKLSYLQYELTVALSLALAAYTNNSSSSSSSRSSPSSARRIPSGRQQNHQPFYILPASSVAGTCAMSNPKEPSAGTGARNRSNSNNQNLTIVKRLVLERQLEGYGWTTGAIRVRILGVIQGGSLLNTSSDPVTTRISPTSVINNPGISSLSPSAHTQAAHGVLHSEAIKIYQHDLMLASVLGKPLFPGFARKGDKSLGGAASANAANSKTFSDAARAGASSSSSPRKRAQPLTKPSSRQLSVHLDTLQQLFDLDYVNVHRFFTQGDAIFFKHFAKSVEYLMALLPNADCYQIAPSQWLFSIATKSDSDIQTYINSDADFSTNQSCNDYSLGLFLLELDFQEGVFATVKLSKVSRCAGALLKLAEMAISHFLSFFSKKLNTEGTVEFETMPAGPGVPSSAGSGGVVIKTTLAETSNLSLSEHAAKFAPLQTGMRGSHAGTPNVFIATQTNLSLHSRERISALARGEQYLASVVRREKTVANQRFSLESSHIRHLLVTELVEAKRDLGFCFASIAPAPAAQATMKTSSVDDALKSTERNDLPAATIRTAYGVCPKHPNGIAGMESLLQCIIECSATSVSIEYVWPRDCNDSTRIATGEVAAKIWSKEGDVAAHYIENLIYLLMQQDKEIFRLYNSAMPLLLNVQKHSSKHAKTIGELQQPFTQGERNIQSSLNFRSYNCTLPDGTVDKVAHHAWKSMLAKGSVETVCLPRILLENKAQFEDEFVVNSLLMGMLHKSLATSIKETSLRGPDQAGNYPDLCMYSGTDDSLIFLYVPRQPLTREFKSLISSKLGLAECVEDALQSLENRTAGPDGGPGHSDSTTVPADVNTAGAAGASAVVSEAPTQLSDGSSESKSSLIPSDEQPRLAASAADKKSADSKKLPRDPMEYSMTDGFSRRYFIGVVLGTLLFPVRTFSADTELCKAAEATLASYIPPSQSESHFSSGGGLDKPTGGEEHLASSKQNSLGAPNVGTTTSTVKQPALQGKQPEGEEEARPQQHSSSMNIVEEYLFAQAARMKVISDARISKGNEVRELKENKAPKELKEPAVKELLDLKEQQRILAQAMTRPTPWVQDKKLRMWRDISPEMLLENVHLSPSGASLSLKELMCTICRKVKDKMLVTHMANYTRMMHAAVRVGVNVPLDSIVTALDCCHDYHTEIDLSVMYQKKAHNLIEKRKPVDDKQRINTVRERLSKDIAAASGVVTSLRDAFENTLGRQLSGYSNKGTRDLFTFSPEMKAKKGSMDRTTSIPDMDEIVDDSLEYKLRAVLKSTHTGNEDSCIFVRFVLYSRDKTAKIANPWKIPLSCKPLAFAEEIAGLMKKWGDEIELHEIWIRMHMLTVRGEDKVFSQNFTDEMYGVSADHNSRFLESQRDKSMKAKKSAVVLSSKVTQMSALMVLRDGQGKYDFVEEPPKVGKKSSVIANTGNRVGSGGGSGGGSYLPMQSAFKRTGFSDYLADGLYAFIVMDTLNSMARMAPKSIRTETLVQVQQCFRDIPQVLSKSYRVDLLCPYELQSRIKAAARGKKFTEAIVQLYEDEIRKCSNNAIARLEDSLYAQYWLVDADVRAPCWILISTAIMSNQPFMISPEGAPMLDLLKSPDSGITPRSKTAAANESASLSLSHIKISVSICKTEGSDDMLEVENAKIAASLRNVFDRAAYNFNQRMLMEDLHDSKVACPYLLHVQQAATVKKEKSSSAASSVLSGGSSSSSSGGGTSDAIARPSNPIRAGGPRDKVVIAPRISVKTRQEQAAAAETARRLEAGPTAAELEKMAQVAAANEAQRKIEQARRMDPLLITSFAMNKFVCPKQGTIKCVLHPGSTITHEMAVRHLETFALAQFVVTNREHFYVSRDMKGNVFYMTFDKPSGSTVPTAAASAAAAAASGGITTTAAAATSSAPPRVVSLSVYGLVPLDSPADKDKGGDKDKDKEKDKVNDQTMAYMLQQLLDDRLTEKTANTVSGILSRTPLLQPSFCTFLKESGASRHESTNFLLPPYIKDVYYFCSIVRQIFANLQLLTVIPAKVVPLSEVTNPATLGYTFETASLESSTDKSLKPSPKPITPRALSSARSFDGAVDYLGNPLRVSMPMAGSSSGRLTPRGRAVPDGPPKLERSVTVTMHNSKTTNPIFFASQKKNTKKKLLGNTGVTGKDVESHQIVWSRPDFSFLYNFMTTADKAMQPGPQPGSTAVDKPAVLQTHTKSAAKHIGQGLALMEMFPKSLGKDFKDEDGKVRVARKLVSTGSSSLLYDDIATMESCFQTGSRPSAAAAANNLNLSVRRMSEADFAALTAATAARPEEAIQSWRVLELHVYPTITMNVAGLVEYCAACINEAVTIYTMGRLCDAAGALQRPADKLNTHAHQIIAKLQAEEFSANLQAAMENRLRHSADMDRTDPNMSQVSLNSIGSVDAEADSAAVLKQVDSANDIPQQEDRITPFIASGQSDASPTPALRKGSNSSDSTHGLWIDDADLEDSDTEAAAYKDKDRQHSGEGSRYPSALSLGALDTIDSENESNFTESDQRNFASSGKTFSNARSRFISNMDRTSLLENVQRAPLHRLAALVSSTAAAATQAGGFGQGQGHATLYERGSVAASHSSAAYYETALVDTGGSLYSDHPVSFAASSCCLSSPELPTFLALSHDVLQEAARSAAHLSESAAAWQLRFSGMQHISCMLTKSAGQTAMADIIAQVLKQYPSLQYTMVLTPGAENVEAKEIVEIGSQLKWNAATLEFLRIQKSGPVVQLSPESDVTSCLFCLDTGLIAIPKIKRRRIAAQKDRAEENRSRSHSRTASEAEGSVRSRSVSIAPIPLISVTSNVSSMSGHWDTISPQRKVDHNSAADNALLAAAAAAAAAVTTDGSLSAALRAESASALDSTLTPSADVGSGGSAYSNSNSSSSSSAVSTTAAAAPFSATHSASGGTNATIADDFFEEELDFGDMAGVSFVRAAGIGLGSGIALGAGTGTGSGAGTWQSGSSSATVAGAGESESGPSALSSLPSWLRKLKSHLEISIAPEGLSLFYSNLSPTIVAFVLEVCTKVVHAVQAKHVASELQFLQHIGIMKPGKVSSGGNVTADSGSSSDMLSSALPRNNAASTSSSAVLSLSLTTGILQRGGQLPNWHQFPFINISRAALQACMASLSWEKRALKRLYLSQSYRHDAANTDKSEQLVKNALGGIPSFAWRRGILMESTFIPLPDVSMCLPAVARASFSSSSSTASVSPMCCCSPTAGRVCPFSVYVSRFIHLSETTKKFEVIRPFDSRIGESVFFVCPVPKTSVVLATEVKCASDGAGVLLTHRALDVLDLLEALCSKADTPPTHTIPAQPSNSRTVSGHHADGQGLNISRTDTAGSVVAGAGTGASRAGTQRGENSRDRSDSNSGSGSAQIPGAVSDHGKIPDVRESNPAGVSLSCAVGSSESQKSDVISSASGGGGSSGGGGDLLSRSTASLLTPGKDKFAMRESRNWMGGSNSSAGAGAGIPIGNTSMNPATLTAVSAATASFSRESKASADIASGAQSTNAMKPSVDAVDMRAVLCRLLGNDISASSSCYGYRAQSHAGADAFEVRAATTSIGNYASTSSSLNRSPSRNSLASFSRQSASPKNGSGSAPLPWSIFLHPVCKRFRELFAKEAFALLIDYLAWTGAPMDRPAKASTAAAQSKSELGGPACPYLPRTPAEYAWRMRGERVTKIVRILEPMLGANLLVHEEPLVLESEVFRNHRKNGRLVVASSSGKTAGRQLFTDDADIEAPRFISKNIAMSGSVSTEELKTGLESELESKAGQSATQLQTPKNREQDPYASSLSMSNSHFVGPNVTFKELSNLVATGYNPAVGLLGFPNEKNSNHEKTKTSDDQSASTPVETLCIRFACHGDYSLDSAKKDAEEGGIIITPSPSKAPGRVCGMQLLFMDEETSRSADRDFSAGNQDRLQTALCFTFVFDAAALGLSLFKGHSSEICNPEQPLWTEADGSVLLSSVFRACSNSSSHTKTHSKGDAAGATASGNAALQENAKKLPRRRKSTSSGVGEARDASSNAELDFSQVKGSADLSSDESEFWHTSKQFPDALFLPAKYAVANMQDGVSTAEHLHRLLRRLLWDRVVEDCWQQCAVHRTSRQLVLEASSNQMPTNSFSGLNASLVDTPNANIGPRPPMPPLYGISSDTVSLSDVQCSSLRTFGGRMMDLQQCSKCVLISPVLKVYLGLFGRSTRHFALLVDALRGAFISSGFEISTYAELVKDNPDVGNTALMAEVDRGSEKIGGTSPIKGSSGPAAAAAVKETVPDYVPPPKPSKRVTLPTPDPAAAVAAPPAAAPTAAAASAALTPKSGAAASKRTKIAALRLKPPVTPTPNTTRQSRASSGMAASAASAAAAGMSSAANIQIPRMGMDDFWSEGSGYESNSGGGGLSSAEVTPEAKPSRQVPLAAKLQPPAPASMPFVAKGNETAKTNVSLVASTSTAAAFATNTFAPSPSTPSEAELEFQMLEINENLKKTAQLERERLSLASRPKVRKVAARHIFISGPSPACSVRFKIVPEVAAIAANKGTAGASGSTSVGTSTAASSGGSASANAVQGKAPAPLATESSSPLPGARVQGNKAWALGFEAAPAGTLVSDSTQEQVSLFTCAIRCDCTGLGCRSVIQQRLFVSSVVRAVMELGEVLFSSVRACPTKAKPTHAHAHTQQTVAISK